MLVAFVIATERYDDSVFSSSFAVTRGVKTSVSESVLSPVVVNFFIGDWVVYAGSFF